MLRFIVWLADACIEEVLFSVLYLVKDMNVKQEYVIYQAVVDVHGLPYVPLI